MSDRLTLLQTQLLAPSDEPPDEPAIHSDRRRPLVPRSSDPPGGAIRLTMHACSPGVSPFKSGRRSSIDGVLSGRRGTSDHHCILAWIWSGYESEKPSGDITYVYVNTKPIRQGLKTRLPVDELSFGQRVNPAYRYIFCLPSAPPATSGGVLEHYDLGPILGKGAFGTVQRALDRTTGQWLACKTVSKDRFAHKPAQLQMVKREVAILQSPEHINGQLIGQGRKASLSVGDELSFGSSGRKLSSADYQEYIFRLPPTPPAPSNDILSQYDLGPRLGQGAFGIVRRVLHRATGQWFACKIISKNQFAGSPTKLQMVEREVAVLRSLDHPHICRLVDHFENESTIWLVLELIEGGNLGEALARESGLPECEVRRLTAEICLAVDYSHSKNIAHRDLKPENILLTNTTPRHAEVADPGLAKAAGDDTFLRTFCGTPVYLAPEVVDQCRQGREYTQLVDSWSMGVIAWSMLTNTMPFVDDGGKAVTRFERQEIDWSQLACRGLSTECIDWTQRMMELDPSRRMTIRAALEHP
ncbi:hypothetical protein FS749_013400 [Ceratobasidium sp. UAMH 11750]|nr:hypothetical protein FS749_013400 [Ceratobasidium sp. UAMH 11750]